jgi:hypothetical protein
VLKIVLFYKIILFLFKKKKKVRGPKGPRAPDCLGGRMAHPSPTDEEREGIIPSHFLLSSSF